MSEKKVQTSIRKRHARAFVPKLTLKRAAVAVVPLCAAGVMAACSGDDDSTAPSVAIIGFDASADANAIPPIDGNVTFTVAALGFDAEVDDGSTVISLAVIGFDAALDDADTTDAADAADGAG